MSNFVEVAKKSQIPEGAVSGVVVGDTALAPVKLEDEVYALPDLCPHEAGPLSEGQVVGEEEGQVVGEEIECQWHRSCFNVGTGSVTRDPATEDVATFKVRIDGDSVQVDIDA